ncbi:MAG: hypothetical protein A2131_02180 [Candidatus Sungbacteria bacterium GWC2_49_10]|uniref:Glycosyltransferase 2-like domain-containing protein n=2 Tax=Parcubacteria group TaxID=1794811 RepID=A0A0G1WMB8_9BACT|nr:MAG: hypothetical protein UY60_C0002G0016 [Parcubacteria group bacterium GW2011_GWB1_50_9]KKW19983.1 MAG: hypothetical protein UY61_C0047G0004 [Candidatus Adlerbacteria bacterium GW2011_GWC1_50_9]OGZ93463.1 MAG: hypothetical protein A2131_02180 [Candidatus Sungbacteria bacterium GWC2_49_10]
MPDKLPISVFILARNSARTLRRALESLRDFDEVFVCDGSSSDETASIAREFGASVAVQDARHRDAEGEITDFSAVRNSCMAHLRNPWVFYIDSDEYVSAECAEEMRKIILAPSAFAWWTPRIYVHQGKLVRCSTSYPNQQMRFFHRGHVKGFIKSVHERIEVLPGERVGALTHPILVPLGDVAGVRRRMAHYLRIESEGLRSVSRIKILKKMLHTFRASLVHVLRMPRFLFCSGKRPPLFYEYARHEYNARLLGLLGKRLLWK